MPFVILITSCQFFRVCSICDLEGIFTSLRQRKLLPRVTAPIPLTLTLLPSPSHKTRVSTKVVKLNVLTDCTLNVYNIDIFTHVLCICKDGGTVTL